MAEYMTTDTELTSVANAIRTKGGTSSPLTYPQGFVTAIQNLPEGGATDEKTVCYYDYDGTLVASYTPEEYAELSEHPANPTHTGLVAQGWNWTLADAKEYVASAGYLDIGQNYITSSGNTEINFELDDPDLLSPCIIVESDAGSSFIIYWGDGESSSYPNQGSGKHYFPHTYSQTGNYTISINFTGNTDYSKYGFAGNNSDGYGSVLFTDSSSVTSPKNLNRHYSHSIKAIRIGENFRIRETRCMQNLINLEYITVPMGTYIDASYAYHFYNCASLIQFTVPKESQISNEMFYNCYKIISVSLPKGCAMKAEAFQFCRKIKSMYLYNSVNSSASYMFYGCSSLKYVKLPGTLYGNKIPNSFFYDCKSLEKITIPSSITEIVQYAFNNTRIKNITLPNGFKFLGSGAFQSSALEGITVSSQLEYIPTRCFDSTFISQITIPSSARYIDNYAFNNCLDLVNVEILSNILTRVGQYAFMSSKVKELTFPETLNQIDQNAFQNCLNLQTITISHRVKKINNYTFDACNSLEKITNAEGINEGGNYAFRKCYLLKDINPILRNRTTLNSYEFYYCYSLDNIIIPSTVTSIGSYCFSGCLPSEYHIRSTTPPTLAASAANTFGVSSGVTKIYVPAGCLETYQTATNWSSRASYMVEEATVACTGITLDKATETLAYVGDAKKITETITPSTCNQDVFYTSSDETCVKVNNCGVVDAVDTGTCTITATCGTQTATCSVTVAGKTVVPNQFTAGGSFEAVDEGTDAARVKYTRVAELSQKIGIYYNTGSSFENYKKIQYSGMNMYPAAVFSYSTNSISIQCDSSIKATFYFVDVYTGATGYENYAKYIGGDSGYDDPNVSKGNRTVSIPSGASGCAICLYKSDGDITPEIRGNIVISVA